MNPFMKVAIEEAETGVGNNEGGPFGSVIVRDGMIIAQAHNEVIKTNDPTAHAEMVAIRKASALLSRFDLSDCEIYSSCEPCPMCLSAIYWARISVVHYGCTKEDAASIGFDDKAIYEYIKHPGQHQREMRLMPMERDACVKVFADWEQKRDRIMY